MKRYLAALGAAVLVALGVTAVAASDPTATIDVAFDGHLCLVTITSTKSISNYVVRDAHGTETKSELTTETSTVTIQLAGGETVTIVSVKSSKSVAGPFGPFSCSSDGHHPHEPDDPHVAPHGH